MPDYLNILTQQQAETDNAIKQKQGGITDVQDPIIPEGQPQEPVPQEPQITPEQQDNQDALDLFRQLKHPMTSQMDRNIPENPNTWTPEFTQRGFIEEVGTSLARGFGKYVVGGTGDIVQLVNGVVPGWEIREGNMLSRSLQAYGKEFEEEYQVFLPEELKDPKFALSTFMNPEFWSKVGAEYVPQLAEMVLLSRGMGGALKAGTRSLAKGVGETMTKETLEAVGKKAVTNTYARAIGGAAKATKEVAGQASKDWRNLFVSPFMTTTGEATQGLLTGAEMFGGGVGMNLLAGLQNAGSLMNEMKILKDPETGEPLYTEEQLGQMAANTMTENMKYLPIDMLSYGMVYAKSTGKFNKLLNPFNKAQGKKFFSASEQAAAVSKGFVQDIKPVMSFMDKIGSKLGKAAERGRKVGSAVAKPIFEGYEETFQETFEDWAVKKAKARVTGEPITIDGKESGDGASDYFSFYFSKENEATRTVAFALGLLGGAGSNIVEAINKKAEIAAKNYHKTELMKHGATNEKGAERLNEYIKQDIVDYIVDGNVDIKANLDALLENEIIDQEGHNDFIEIASTLEEAYQKAENLGSLNVAGKIAFLENKLKAKVAEMGMAYQEEKTKKRIQALKEEHKNEPAVLNREVKDAEDKLEVVRAALTKQMAEGNQGVLNILHGEKADVSHIKYVDDGKGNQVAVALSEEDYDNFYNKTDKEIYDAAREKAYDPRPGLSKMGNTLKDFYKAAAEKLGKFKDQGVKKANDYLDNRNNKKVEELAKQTEVAPLTAESKLEGKLKVGNQEIDLDEIAQQPEEQQAESIKDINKTISEHNKSIKEAKKQVEKIQQTKASEDEKGGRMYKAGEQEDETLTPEDIIEAAKLQNEPVREKTKVDQFIEKTFNTAGETNIATAEAEMEVQIKKAKIDFKDEAKAREAIKDLIDEKIGKIGEVSRAGEEGGLDAKVFEDYLFKLGKEGAFIKETAEEKTNREDKAKKKKDKIKRVQEARKERPERKNFELARQSNKFSNPNWNEEYQKIIKHDPAQAETLQKEYDAYLSSTIARATMKPSVIMQQITVNQHLRRIFPNTGIQVYAMDNLYNALKEKEYETWEDAAQNGPALALGYAIGSAIMIDEKAWSQDEIFMHEFAHIHYSLSENEPATVEIVKEALKDKEKVAYIKSQYADQIYYEYKQKNWKPGMDRARAMKANLADEELKALNDQIYGKKNDKGRRDKRTITAREMPMEYQDVILDELFADYLQGPLAKSYNKYFRPNNEFTRQQKVKGWWKWLKNKALANEEEYVDVLKTLEQGNTVPIDNLRNHVMKNFVDMVKGKDVSLKGRYSKYASEKAALIANENAIVAIDYANEQNQTLTQAQIEFQQEMVDSIDNIDRSKIGTVIDDYDYFAEHEEVAGAELYKVDDDFQSLVENSAEMDLGTLWDNGFDLTNLKNNKMIRYFIVQYNKKANERRSKRITKLKAASNATDDIKKGLLTDDKGEVVDATFYEGINITNFTQKLEDLAKGFDSHIDFIRVLRNSEIPEQKEFMKHLTKEYKDPLQRLRTMHLLYANSQVLTSIIHYVDKNGKYKTLIPQSSQDPQVVKRVQERIKIATAEEQQAVRDAIFQLKAVTKEFLELNEAGRLKTAKAIDTIVSFYGHDKILSNRILEEGYLIVNKENRTLVNGLKYLINESNIGEDLRQNNENIIKAILNTSKLYDSTSVVVGPNKTNLTTRMFSNHSIKLFNKMITALKQSQNNEVDKAKFLKEFSNAKRTERPNALLENYWNNFHTTGQVPLMAIDFGSENKMFNKSKNQKDASAEQQLINEMLQFQEAVILDNERRNKWEDDPQIVKYDNQLRDKIITEAQHKQYVKARKEQLKELSTNNYLASMDIFGNSNRRILMSIPRINVLNAKGDFKVSEKALHFKKIHEIYEKMTFDKTADIKNEAQAYAADYNQFEDSLDQAIDWWSQYLLKHHQQFAKLETFKNIYTISETSGASLNAEGQALVKNFVFNRVVNTFYMHEIMNPGVLLNNITKVHKGQIAPVIALDPNLKVEGIPMADEFNIPEPIKGEENPNETKADFNNRHRLWKYNRIITNDGMQYILSEHAEQIKAMNPDFGEGYKLYSNTINKENPFFMNQMGQMKGYTTVLTEEDVLRGNQKHLYPIWKLLNERYDKFKKDYSERYNGEEYSPVFRGQSSTDMQREKYIPIIIPVSADKSSLFSIKELDHLQQRYTLEQLKDPAKYKEYTELLDKIYYPKGANYNGGFVGLNGDNFGPQQIMDKNYTSATLSVQAISAFPFAQEGVNFDRALKIQDHISQQKWNNLKVQVFDRLKEKNITDDYGYSNFIMETANKLDSDPYTIRALFSGEMPYSPHLAEFALNQFRAQMIRHGNNVKVPGTYGQTISDMGYMFTSDETYEIDDVDASGNKKRANREAFINKSGRQNVYPRVNTEQYINGTSALNFYWSEKEDIILDDGSPSTVSRTRPMEIIVPQNQFLKGVIARQKFFGENAGINDATAYLTEKTKNGDYVQLSTLQRLKLVNGNNNIIEGAIEKMLSKNTIYSDKESKNQIGVYVPGENVITTRIPNNGPAFIGIGEVVGFHNTGASNIIAPKEFTRIIGADFDGDALFVYRQGKDENGLVDKRMGDTKDKAGYGHWNKAFDLILEQWASPNMRHILESPLNFEDTINDEIKVLNRKLQPERYSKIDENEKLFNENKITESEFKSNETKIKSEGKFVMPFSPEHFTQQYNNSVIAKQTVGIAQNIHRAINMVSAYDTQLSNGMTVTTDGNLIPNLIGVNINGKRLTRFNNEISREKSGQNTRIQQSAMLANIVLDSLKNGHADALNLNKNSIASAMLLINLGFNIQDIGLLLNHPIAKQYIESRNNIGNDYIDDGGYAKMLYNYKEQYKDKNLSLNIYGYPSEFNVDVNPLSKNGKNPNYESDENSMEIIRLMHYLSKMADDFSTITDITSGHNKIENNPFALEKQIKDLEFLLDNKKRDSFNGRNTSTLYFKKQGKTKNAILSESASPVVEKNRSVDVLNSFLDENGIEMYRVLYKVPGQAPIQVETRADNVTLINNIPENPEIKHYIRVAKEYAIHQKNLNIVYNDSVRNIFDLIKRKITGEELTGKQLIHYTEKIIPFIYARLAGFNDPANLKEINEMFRKADKDGNIALVDELDKYAKELDAIEHFRDPDNVLKKDTEFTRSLIFNQGLVYNNNRVKLNPQVLQQHFTDENAKALKEDFATLPLKLQRQLVLYDLIVNGWSGENSLYPLFSYDITKFITDRAVDFQNKLESDKKFSDDIGRQAFRVIQDLETINTENNYLPKIYLDKVNSKNFDQKFLGKLQENKHVLSRITGTEPFRVTAIYQGTTGQISQVYEIKPIGPELTKAQWERLPEQESTAGKKQLARARKTDNYTTIVKGHITTLMNKGGFKLYKLAEHPNLQALSDISEDIPNVHMILIKDGTTDPNNNPNETIPHILIPEMIEQDNAQRAKKKSNVTTLGRFFRTDYNNFVRNKRLSMEELLNAYEYKQSLTSEQEGVIYNKYLADKKIANQDKGKWVNADGFIKEGFTEEELIKGYEKYGSMDAYATANIMVPIMLELIQRESNYQSYEITKRLEGTKDITPMKAWFQSNNIDSSHPATQAIQREIETEFKYFVNERKGYMEKIDQVTEALYAEKLGYSPVKNSFIKRIQIAGRLLFRNRDKIYQTLYGNIVKVDDRINKDNEQEKRFQLLTTNELKERLKTGEISQAEYNFAETFREISKELQPKNKEYYTGIPQSGPGIMEAFARKGMLGVLVSTRPTEQAMYDVYMNYDGQRLTFKQIEDIYRQDLPSNWKNNIDYIKLRNKARKLYKQGVNEDGSIYHHGKVFNHTILGDGMANNFANGGWVNANDFLSMDLNKSLSDFAHAQLFMEGNENFTGFKTMQAKVDGLLLHNKMKGFDNQNLFVQKVYKEYFLKGKKLNKTTSGDKVMDAMIRGNLLYIMGWKLLAVGKGLYTIGNIVVGKYNNIKNQGGKTWARGEARYWGINQNGSKHRKAMGVLKTLNFMNISFYDDVNMSRSSGLDRIFSDIALMPMHVSENWIQGAHFLGMLSEDQWNSFDDNGEYKTGSTQILPEELIKIENEVKNSHGKGYTPTDQRLIQRYSWGRAIMQFSRFIPTMFYDRFAKEDINIYGEKHIGSLRALWEPIAKAVGGEMTYQEFIDYRNHLKKTDPEKLTRFDSALRGLALVSVAIIAGKALNMGVANELAGDANYLFNQEKMQYKAFPPVVRTFIDMFSVFSPS